MKKFSLTLITFLLAIALPFKVFAADLTNIQETLSNYLPYILIGGAVILLISIVGILLSKKKDSKADSEPITMAQPATPEPTATESIPEVQPVEQENIEMPTTQTEAPSSGAVSNNLYAPSPTEEVAEPVRPSIQETLESAPMSNTTPEPMVDNSGQVSDLQAISQAEAATEPMSPVTGQSTDTTVAEEPTLQPISEPSPVPPIDTSTNNVPDLQPFVNNQVEQVPPTTTTELPTQSMPMGENSVTMSPDVNTVPTQSTPPEATPTNPSTII